MKEIVILFGGESVESEVSCITGVLTLNALKKHFKITPVYVDKNGEWFTGEDLFNVENYKNLKVEKLKKVTILPSSNKLFELKGKKLKELFSISLVVNCMHGGNGENGSFRGLLDISKIPTLSSPVLSSALSMDKIATKIFLKGLDIPYLPYFEYEEGKKRKLGFPLIVKPNSLGSSIGISVCKTEEEYESAISTARRFDDRVLVEKKLENFLEINLAVYKLKDKIVVSKPENPIVAGGFLGFEDKYVKGERIFPANIDKELNLKINKIAKKIYSALNFEGIIRIDFLVKEDKVYVNEINAIPGSLSYYLFYDSVFDFSYLLKDMIFDTLERFNKKQTLVKSFSSSILNLKGVKGQKRL